MTRKDAARRLTLAFAIAITPVLAMHGETARAQDTSSLINQALDQPVKMQLDTVLPEAMSQIARKTGVRVRAEQAVWDLLPWGQNTNLNATIENQTLRQALGAISRKLGLVMVLKDEALELQPMPALRRVGRRATIDELQALDFLTATPMDLKADRPTVKELVDAVDQKLAAAKSPFAIEYRPGDAVRPEKTVFVPRNATLAEALESIAKETALTWYPWGKTILIVPKEEQVRTQLSKTITMRFAGVDVGQVLNELSQRAGVRFEIEPGAIQRVPQEVRNIHLMLDNSSILQALETIAGFTDLGYVVTPQGVYLWNRQYQPAGAGRDRVVGTVALPESNIQVFLFESQLPPDVKEYFRLRKEKELEHLRQKMAEQGFKPTTQPATTSRVGTPEDL